MQPAFPFRCALSALPLLAVLGCRPDTGSETDALSAVSIAMCATDGIRANERLVLEPASSIVSDFDCSGTLDSAVVARRGVGTYLVMDRAGRRDSLSMPEESSISIVGLADANADGRLDLLLVDQNESQFAPHVIVLADSGFQRLPFAMPDDLGTPAVLIGIENSDECLARAMPRFERVGEGAVTISLVVNTRVSLQCDDMPRMNFRVDSDRVRPLTPRR